MITTARNTLALILASRLQRLPLGVRESTERLLARPEEFFDAEDVARHARISRRHVDRIFQVAGLAPAKRLVICARSCAALDVLSCAAISVDAAARRFGYEGERGFRRHTDMVWHVAPRRVMLLAESLFVTRLSTFVLSANGRELAGEVCDESNVSGRIDQDSHIVEDLPTAARRLATRA